MLGVFCAGRIINPKNRSLAVDRRNDLGVSSALHEAAHVDPRHGNWVNGDLAEYLVPVQAEIPDIQAIMLDDFDERANPLGIKGVGELGISGTARRSPTSCSRDRRPRARLPDHEGQAAPPPAGKLRLRPQQNSNSVPCADCQKLMR